jgi:hypothetical protein
MDLFPSSDEDGDTFSIGSLRKSLCQSLDIFNKQKAVHIHKFSLLNNQQNKVLSTTASDCKKFIVSLAKHVLTDSEEAVLVKDLNFSVANPHTNLDVACTVESSTDWAWNSGGRSGPC